MHFGSLTTALASFLNVRQQNGEWLLRIEDVDALRCKAEYSQQIIQQLETLGLHWDGEVSYQSDRTPLYEAALAQLEQQQLTYPCGCSRKEIAAYQQAHQLNTTAYPGICRLHSCTKNITAIRLKTSDQIIHLSDGNWGEHTLRACEQGDFIIKRKDGLIAYQLAVVVDDFQQQITEIVRGSDLWPLTAGQCYLQQQLGYPRPSYFHLPLAMNQRGDKQSKQTKARPLDLSNVTQTLWSALDFLNQQPPKTLLGASRDAVLQWAIEHWKPALIGTRNRTIQPEYE